MLKLLYHFLVPKPTNVCLRRRRRNGAPTDSATRQCYCSPTPAPAASPGRTTSAPTSGHIRDRRPWPRLAAAARYGLSSSTRYNVVSALLAQRQRSLSIAVAYLPCPALNASHPWRRWLGSCGPTELRAFRQHMRVRRPMVELRWRSCCLAKSGTYMA